METLKKELVEETNEMADNAVETEGVEVTETEETDAEFADSALEFTDGSPKEDEEELKVKQTKAFSKRLNEERAKIIESEETKAREKLDNVAKSRGFDSWEELEKYDRQEKIENLGISDANTFEELVAEAISNNPDIIEARKIIEQNRQQEEATMIAESVADINKLDPDVTSIDDIIEMDNFDDILDLVKKGNSLVDAYKVVAFDKITAKKATNVATEKAIKSNSKSHMKSVKGTHTTTVSVPEDILLEYKRNNPNMTDDDIVKHYNEYINN